MSKVYAGYCEPDNMVFVGLEYEDGSSTTAAHLTLGEAALLAEKLQLAMEQVGAKSVDKN